MAIEDRTSHLTDDGTLILEGRHKLCFYIGIPFCKMPCSYCHYKPNLTFGHSAVPDAYVDSIVCQLQEFCEANRLHDEEMVSCYFGGGTPSLLSKNQLLKIIHVFENRRIEFAEKSIEVHPLCRIQEVVQAGFFNRFSIGLQSCSEEILTEWGRPKDSVSRVRAQIDFIRECVPGATVNIDILFKTALSYEDVAEVNNLAPETIVVYPMTGERNEIEAAQTYWTLFNLNGCFPGYTRPSLASFHFSRGVNLGSRYAEAQYTNSASVVGFGHNSLSYVNGVRYLSRRDERGRMVWKKKDANWFKDLFYNTLTVGIPTAALGSKQDVLFDSGVLCHGEKQGPFLRFSRDNWKKAVVALKTQGQSENLGRFFGGLFWADSRTKDLDVFFDEWLKIAIGAKELSPDLLDMLYLAVPSKDMSSASQLSDLEVLIEGIDGSGKDTFARYLCEFLKERVVRGPFSISIVGDPSSEERYGHEVKRFVEDASTELGYAETCHRLKANRHFHHDHLARNYPGMRIFVRSVMTEVATLKIVFPDERVEPADLTDFAKVIFVKVDPRIADDRIDKRGKPRTWREDVKYLRRFDELFTEQIRGLPDALIVENSSDNETELKLKARAVGALLLSSCLRASD